MTEISIQKKALFPTSLWQIRFSEDKKENLDELLLRKIMSTKGTPDAVVESDKKWYTPRNLHDTKEFERFNDLALEASRACLDNMRINYEGIAITGCWGNVSSPGATHHQHSHPNNYLSGCYYLQADAGANSITFYDPRPRQNIRPPTHGLSLETAEEMHLEVNPGDLIMFPNWLVHSVGENRSNRARISIAFNVMFTNYMSDMVAPMW